MLATNYIAMNQFTGFNCLLLLSFLLTWIHTPVAAQRVIQIGTELTPGGLGEDVLGATFLLNDDISVEGILYAYSAYVNHRSRVRFQVWRPSNGSNALNYDLISEIQATPTTTDQREDFYIESLIVRQCVVTQPGDRLGVYFEELPWALGYKFDRNTPRTLQYQVPNISQPIELYETVLFDELTFPYDFSLIAYLDTEVDNITVDDVASTTDCPRGLLIPDYIVPTALPTTRTPPITGRPGDTGATGPIGATGETGPIGPQGIPGNETWGHTGATGPMGIEGPMGEMGATGEVGLAGYNGSTGATGPMGLEGASGSTGPMGPQGLIGATGPIADVEHLYEYVDNKTREAVDEIPTPAAQTDDTEFWGEPDMVLYAYIWLAILTILLIILLIIVIVLCCMVRRMRKDIVVLQKTQRYHPETYDNPDLLAVNRERELTQREKELDEKIRQLSTYDPKPEWMNSMKPDQFMDYEVGTIEREASQRRAKRNSAELSAHNNDSQGDTLGSSTSKNNGTLTREEINMY